MDGCSAGKSRWGLVDASRDPTLDLYGWDQVASRIKQLGLIDNPDTFVFTRYWYQSAQLAYALGRNASRALLQRRRPARLCLLEPARGMGGPRRNPGRGR